MVKKMNPRAALKAHLMKGANAHPDANAKKLKGGGSVRGNGCAKRGTKANGPLA